MGSPRATARTSRPFPLLVTGAALMLGLLSTVGCTGGAQGTASPQPSASAAAAGLRVAGNQLEDASHHALRLVGVNRSGTEYACVQGFGPFDGPSDDASVAAIAAWQSNVVRIPLNEDCWLGLNGQPNAGYTATEYRQAIVRYVETLHAHRLYAMLDLHWSAPGTSIASGQTPMPDADHSPAFWQSVAATFKDDGGLVFDLFNEPYPERVGGIDDPWGCWRNGCSITDAHGTWQAAGMQSLVSAVRGAGAAQPILVSGLAYANDLSGWLLNEPLDPLHQLVAAWHSYPDNACNTRDCWDRQVPVIAARVPVLTSEVGDAVCTPGTYASTLLPYLDAHGIGYLGWTWDTWQQCSNVLVASYGGQPSQNFGQFFHDHIGGRLSSAVPVRCMPVKGSGADSCGG
jgi:endoglucanase